MPPGWARRPLSGSCLTAVSYTHLTLPTQRQMCIRDRFPLALFLVGGVLAFATGTSWGTMGILIPVAVPVFAGSPLLPMAVAAVCAGAVMGDHCSPISDTSIMSSTGAGCDHMAHVNTQLWYGLAVAADCTVCYLLAPALGNPWVPLAIGAALVTGQVFLLNRVSRRRAGEAV